MTAVVSSKMRANALALFGYSSMQAAEGEAGPTIVIERRIDATTREVQGVSVVSTREGHRRPTVAVLPGEPQLATDDIDVPAAHKVSSF